MDTMTQAADDRFVTVNGLRLRYIEQGTGQPVILLHGASLGSSADVFIRNLQPLADGGVRPIAYDQPGFGLSDTPTDLSVAYRRDSIIGLLDALGLEKAAIVGHSQAGNMAFATALAHPDRIASVVVLGTGSLLPPLPDDHPATAAPRVRRWKGVRAHPPRRRLRTPGSCCKRPSIITI